MAGETELQKYSRKRLYWLSNWDKFKRICEAVAAQDDVIACSIGEAFRQHQIDHGNMDRMAAFRRNKRTL